MTQRNKCQHEWEHINGQLVKNKNGTYFARTVYRCENCGITKHEIDKKTDINELVKVSESITVELGNSYNPKRVKELTEKLELLKTEINACKSECLDSVPKPANDPDSEPKNNSEIPDKTLDNEIPSVVE